MKVIAVDDKPVPRRALVRAVHEADPDAEIASCASGEEVLSLPDLKSFDVAFIDIDMPGITGVQLARELKALNPDLNVVFATGYGEYMADAFELHSSGYLMKPITPEKVKAELGNLRHPPHRSSAKLVVQCFGDFEVFAQGAPVKFERSKTKELFAYLVDRRGAECSITDIEAVFWGDRAGSASQRSYIRTLVADMKATLDTLGFDNVIVKRRAFVGIRPDAIECDYYSFLNGDPSAIASFSGEYMRQYSWAETTHAGILNKNDKQFVT